MVFEVFLKVNAFSFVIANNPVNFLIGLETYASKLSDRLFHDIILAMFHSSEKNKFWNWAFKQKFSDLCVIGLIN